MELNDLVEEYLFECESRRLSENTIDNYKKQISYLVNFLKEEYEITEVEEVKATHIKKYLNSKLKSGNKVNYINDLLKVYKTMFKYFHEEEYISELITAKVHNMKKPKVIIRTFTDNDIKCMLDYYTGKDFLNIRNQTILVVLFDTGIRLSELLNLKLKDIKDDYIVIVSGKGNKDRVVPKSPFLAKWLLKHEHVRKMYFSEKFIDDKELFLSRNCRKLSREMVERIVKNAGEYAQVSEDIRVSPHTCRHTYAQMQLRNGLDIYTLSRILGHESISITQVYLNGIRDEAVIVDGLKTSPLMNL